MKKLLLILLIYINFLQAYEYSLSGGWQMVGVMEKIEDMSLFNNSCVREVWSYDSKNLIWHKYNPLDKNSSTLTNLNEAVGIWIKCQNGCKIYPPIELSFTNIYRGNSFSENNISKQIEVIANSEERFNELYYSNVDNYTPKDINWSEEEVIFIRSRYTNSVMKDIVRKRNITYIDMETTITENKCEKNETLYYSPFSFTSIPRVGLIIFDENIKMVDCKGKEIEDKEINQTFKLIDFKYSDIGSIYSGGYGYKKFEVIREYDNTTLSNEVSSTIDFEKETLIAIFMGTFNLTGLDIDVKEVREYDKYIEVEIENSIAHIGCPIEFWSISPSVFITIPKTDKEIIFKETINFTLCPHLYI